MSRRRTRALLAAALTPATMLATAAVGAPSAAAATTLGGAGSYSVTHAVDPVTGRTVAVRWNPCQTIGYRVNPAAGGTGALADVQRAMAQVSAASGLHFRYLGSTSYVPTPVAGGYDPRQSRVAPLVISWGRSGYLTPAETGYGGWLARGGPGERLQIVAGYVVIRPGGLRPGFGAGVTRGRVLLHELGHAVGLNHVSDPRMEMNPYVSPSDGAAGYRAGDLTGLRVVGAGGGCL